MVHGKRFAILIHSKHHVRSGIMSSKRWIVPRQIQATLFGLIQVGIPLGSPTVETESINKYPSLYNRRVNFLEESKRYLLDLGAKLPKTECRETFVQVCSIYH